MNPLKERTEAILFAIGNKISTEELAKLINSDEQATKQILEELQKEYLERPGSLKLQNDGKYWKLTIKDEHLTAVQGIVKETELDKQTMETLAVLAYKCPTLQSEVIKIRTNKAYDHLKLLEEQGYITKEPAGRTRLIKLAQKFFEYFELPPEKLREMFNGIQEAEKTIEAKEDEMKGMKEQIKEVQEQKKEEADKQAQEAEQQSVKLELMDKQIADTMDEEGIEPELKEPEYEEYDETKKRKRAKPKREVKGAKETNTQEENKEEVPEEAQQSKEEQEAEKEEELAEPKQDNDKIIEQEEEKTMEEKPKEEKESKEAEEIEKRMMQDFELQQAEKAAEQKEEKKEEPDLEGPF